MTTKIYEIWFPLVYHMHVTIGIYTSIVNYIPCVDFFFLKTRMRISTAIMTSTDAVDVITGKTYFWLFFLHDASAQSLGFPLILKTINVVEHDIKWTKLVEDLLKKNTEIWKSYVSLSPFFSLSWKTLGRGSIRSFQFKFLTRFSKHYIDNSRIKYNISD